MPDYAPGSRVLIRDEEWVVRDVAPCDHGGDQLECMGISETVLNREGIFLSSIDKVTILDPAETELVADSSPEFIESRLYLEAKILTKLVPDIIRRQNVFTLLDEQIPALESILTALKRAAKSKE
jgi:hypothetical protein